ncbi:hypothetical protein [Candidatus Amarobacter glycogenicus]|uniref:hypothetical protein n=1 Tax=Candidatus Amarobacter glycogenicus TaxID=3140699 RepID=UPI0031373F74|nr:hypothetical protein [Dehalococcoidia bacterium]
MVGGEKLARAFAAAEPNSVTLDIEAEEEKLLAQGYGPGDRFWHDYLRKKRPAFALARQWAGTEHERARLNKEIVRLQNLLDEGLGLEDRWFSAGTESAGGMIGEISYRLDLTGAEEVRCLPSSSYTEQIQPCRRSAVPKVFAHPHQTVHNVSHEEPISVVVQ